MANQHERITAERHDLQLRIALRIGHEAEVHDIAEHVVINLVGAPVFHVDVDRGVFLEKAFDIRWQIVQADAVNRGDANGSRNDVLDLLQLAVQGVVGLDDLFAEIVKQLAFAGEAEFFLAAFNEKRLELPFQGADLLADSGLCNTVDLCGLGEAFGFGEVAKDFETFYLHLIIEYANKAVQSTGVDPEVVSTCLTLTSNSWLEKGFWR